MKITFGQMREGRGGTRHILIYCNDCGHSGTMSADRWGDDVRLSDIEARLVCRACGQRGAEVRPDLDRGEAPLAGTRWLCPERAATEQPTAASQRRPEV